jgi:hypothetical protein
VLPLHRRVPQHDGPVPHGRRRLGRLGGSDFDFSTSSIDPTRASAPSPANQPRDDVPDTLLDPGIVHGP